jgi:uncharacterized membrane protein
VLSPIRFGRSLPRWAKMPVNGQSGLLRRRRTGSTIDMKASALAGPEGHPIHPFLVPLPIGAFVSSLIFDILTWTKPDGLPYLVDGAYWLIGVGLIGALIAAVFGVLDLVRIPRRTPPFTTALTHLSLNVVAAVLFIVGYYWRAGDHVELDRTRPGQLALSAVAVAVLIVAVWLGQKLTYRYGMRVSGRRQ